MVDVLVVASHHHTMCHRHALQRAKGIGSGAFQDCVHIFGTALLQRFFQACPADGERNVIVVYQGLEIFLDGINRLIGSAPTRLEMLEHKLSDPGAMLRPSIF